MKRVNIYETQPKAYEAMFGLEGYLGESSIEEATREIVRLRASMINGCAYCIQLHSSAAEKLGVETKKLLAVAGWRESPLFSDEERAVLAYTDAVTRIADNGVSDEIYAAVAEFYSPEQIAQLTVLVATINAWNRFAVATKVK